MVVDKTILSEIKTEVQAYLDEYFIDEEIALHASYCVDVTEMCDTREMYSLKIKNCCHDLDIIEFETTKPTFSQMLFKYIKEKSISETDCYKNANLDRRLFSKIRSNDNYQSRKNTVFAFIIGLKLGIDEAEELLDSAGYSISHSIKLDVIMEYVIEKQIYDIMVVNEILYSFDCPILGLK